MECRLSAARPATVVCAHPEEGGTVRDAKARSFSPSYLPSDHAPVFLRRLDDAPASDRGAKKAAQSNDMDTGSERGDALNASTPASIGCRSPRRDAPIDAATHRRSKRRGLSISDDRPNAPLLSDRFSAEGSDTLNVSWSTISEDDYRAPRSHRNGLSLVRSLARSPVDKAVVYEEMMAPSDPCYREGKSCLKASPGQPAKTSLRIKIGTSPKQKGVMEPCEIDLEFPAIEDSPRGGTKTLPKSSIGKPSVSVRRKGGRCVLSCPQELGLDCIEIEV
eukprot:CAMPEP_0169127542 /NCGR_PEP_ID=MMETSP1015-20121227/36063_1 /TAXON_ID=342587 /ORGANISM="Karlodinium micrum, Strain CCMP2283" /LENGTH=276 /DNA_ID=CAMNT_0009191331 /DNA_START=86 /DNA_END=917 /DNA_ORIENTATION=+